MRLLLVEDDHDLARAVDKSLTEEGYVVDSVSTGEGALFLVEQAEHDVALVTT